MRLTPRDVRTVFSVAELDLVTAARSGNLQAREALFRRHVQLVNGLARRLCGRFADANLVTSEIFRVAFTSGWELPHPEALRPWLVCAVTKAAQRSIKKELLRARLPLLQWFRTRDERDASAARARRFEAELDTLPRDTAIALRRFYDAVDRLPVRTRTLLILRHLEGLSLPEIAMTLEMPVGGVRRTLARVESKAPWRRTRSALGASLRLVSPRTS